MPVEVIETFIRIIYLLLHDVGVIYYFILMEINFCYLNIAYYEVYVLLYGNLMISLHWKVN